MAGVRSHARRAGSGPTECSVGDDFGTRLGGPHQGRENGW